MTAAAAAAAAAPGRAGWHRWRSSRRPSPGAGARPRAVSGTDCRPADCPRHRRPPAVKVGAITTLYARRRRLRPPRRRRRGPLTITHACERDMRAPGWSVQTRPSGASRRARALTELRSRCAPECDQMFTVAEVIAHHADCGDLVPAPTAREGGTLNAG